MVTLVPPNVPPWCLLTRERSRWQCLGISSTWSTGSRLIALGRSLVMKTDIPLFLATDIFNRVEVSVEPVEKWADRNETQQATDRKTGEPIWVTQVYVRSPKGDVAVLPVRTSGAKPSV